MSLHMQRGTPKATGCISTAGQCLCFCEGVMEPSKRRTSSGRDGAGFGPRLANPADWELMTPFEAQERGTNDYGYDISELEAARL